MPVRRDCMRMVGCCCVGLQVDALPLSCACAPPLHLPEHFMLRWAASRSAELALQHKRGTIDVHMLPRVRLALDTRTCTELVTQRQ